MVPLGQRPAGQQLLHDAQARRFGVVLIYRVDRLGRSLAALLDAHQVLSASGITLRSATEPFDTATPIGTFFFQLLGSMAELERSTIQERMTLGKARTARQGKWTAGPIPFGYDVNEAGFLVPSARMLAPLGMTEADAAREIFARIASGSSIVRECRRLNALGVTPLHRYRGREHVQRAEAWSRTQLWGMLHSRLYRGEHTYQSRHGAIIREVPALISPDVWQEVQQQLTRHQTRPKGTAMRLYLLRGLIRCGNCGAAYVGAWQRKRGWEKPYYRCGSFRVGMPGLPRVCCPGKMLPAEAIEQEVWAACRVILHDPGAALSEAHQQRQARHGNPERQAQERVHLQAALAEQGQERARVMTMARRGHITLQECATQIETMAQEARLLQTELDALNAQQTLCEASEQYDEHLTGILRAIQAEVAQMETAGDAQKRRHLLDLLVRETRITTQSTGRRKASQVSIEWWFFASASLLS